MRRFMFAVVTAVVAVLLMCFGTSAAVGASTGHSKNAATHQSKTTHGKGSTKTKKGSGAKKGKKEPSSSARKRAAAHYLSIVRPFNSALSTFQADLKAKGTTLTATELGTAAAPVAQALQKVDQQLSSYSWPKNARTNITTLVQADGALLGDLASAGSVNALTASSWVQQFVRDDSVAGTDSGLVRSALGLPQQSTGT